MGWNPFKEFGSWFEKKVWKPVTNWAKETGEQIGRAAKDIGEGILDVVTFGGYSDMKDAAARNNQAKREATQAYQDSLWDLATEYENALSADIFSELDTFQTQIKDFENQLELAQKDTIPEYQEWLSNYQGMLEGEDNILSQEREGHVANISNAEGALKTHEYKSALAVQNMFDEANEQVAAAKKDISLANVAASATGTALGAYKTEALKMESNIRRYIGADGYLNEDTGVGAIGTFAMALMDTRNTIRDEKNRLQLNIDSLKLTLAQWDEDMERLAAQTEIDLDVAQDNVELWKDQIELNKINLQTKTQEAIETLNKWETSVRDYYTSTGEKTSEEVDFLIEEKKKTWKEQYGILGIDIDPVTIADILAAPLLAAKEELKKAKAKKEENNG